MMHVVVLGAGRVAGHLIQSLNKAPDIQVVQVYSRKSTPLAERFPEVNFTQDLNALQTADVYLMSVTDDAIISLSEQLPFEKQLVVHTSGSTSLEAIHPKNRGGVFYPLQTFSQEKHIDFKVVPICLEATTESDAHTLETLARALSDHIYWLNSEQRLALHVAAVFVCNFVNHLYVIGADICREHQLPFELLQPLIQETAEKIMTMHPKEAQTGPALRNDRRTLEKHAQFMEGTPYHHLYQRITESIQNHVQKL